ncbi:MAG: radical SAM protein [Anaerolineales bacterium]|nr:radical SAM protein [Anaerolineales bacterium]
MKLNSLHVLLTYRCNYECDHCFVWGSPWQSGVFTLAQLEDVFQQALALGTITEFYFEGGETFVYYPVLLKAVKRAHALGFATGIVTNGYWATSEEDARAWLEPLAEAGLDQIEISNDAFHGATAVPPSQHIATQVASQLGLHSGLISLEPPQQAREENGRGLPVVGGDVMFRGRAAVKLTEGLPRHPWNSFTTCPYENLADPGRVHLDPFGYLHLCQGIAMGNVWERPLRDIVHTYHPQTHPIVKDLLAGGPTQLIKTHQLDHDDSYVDACHLCYTARETLRERFADVLAPDQMYGVT